MELGYFGEVFGRPSGRELPWFAVDGEPDGDMWATAEESRDEIIELHAFSAGHSDATIEALAVPGRTADEWAAYRARLEEAARAFR